MKRFLLTLGLSAALMLAPATVFAQDSVCDVTGAPSNTAFCEGENDPDAQGNATDNAVLDVLGTVVLVLTSITAVISVFVIIIAGLMFTVSNGDPSRAARARSAIIYAVVALITSIFAGTLLGFILGRI